MTVLRWIGLGVGLLASAAVAYFAGPKNGLDGAFASIVMTTGSGITFS